MGIVEYSQIQYLARIAAIVHVTDIEQIIIAASAHIQHSGRFGDEDVGVESNGIQMCIRDSLWKLPRPTAWILTAIWNGRSRNCPTSEKILNRNIWMLSCLGVLQCIESAPYPRPITLPGSSNEDPGFLLYAGGY